MKIRMMLLISVLAILAAGFAWAGGDCCPAEEQCCPTVRSNEAANNYLTSLDAMIGTWAGEGEMPEFGKFTDTFTCTWELNNTWVKGVYQASVDGQPMWSDVTYFGWDSDNNRPTQISFGQDGSFGIASSVEQVSVNKTVVTGHSSAPEGSPMKDWRFIHEMTDADTCVTTCEFKKGEEFVPFFSTTSKRQK